MGQRVEVPAEARRWSAGSGPARLPSPSSPPTSPRFTRRRDASSPPSSPGLGPGRPSRRTDNARDNGHVALGRQGLAVMQGRRLSDSSSSVSVLGVVEEQAGDTGEGSRQGSVDAFEAMSNSSQISDSGSYSGSAPTTARNGHVHTADAARQTRLALEPRYGGQAAILATHADVDRYHESGRQLGQMLRGGAGPARIVSPAERAVAAELATLADSVTDADVYAPSPAAAALMSATDGLFSAASAYVSASVPAPPGSPSPIPPYSLSAHQPVSSSPWPPMVVALARPPDAGLGGLDVRARLGRTLRYGSAGGGGEVGGSWATVGSGNEGQGMERQQQQPTKDAKELARSLLRQLSGGKKGGGAPQVIAVRNRSGGEAAQRDFVASGVSAAMREDGLSEQRQRGEGVTSAFAGRTAEIARETEPGEVDSVMTQRGAYNEKQSGAIERTGGGVMGGASFDDDVMVMAQEGEQHEDTASWRQPWSLRRPQPDGAPPQRQQQEEVERQQQQEEQQEQQEEERLERQLEQVPQQVELQEQLQKQINLQQQADLQQQEEERSEETEAESSQEEEEEQLVRIREEEQAVQQRQQKLPSQPSLFQQQQQGQQQGPAGGSPVSTLDVALSKGSPSTDAGEEEDGVALHARMHAFADAHAHWLSANASPTDDLPAEADAEECGGAEVEAGGEAEHVCGDEPCVPGQQASPLLCTQGDKAPDSSMLAPANPPLTTAATPAAGPLQPSLPAPPPALPPPPLESLSTVDLGTLAFVPSPAGMEEDLEYIRYVLVAAGFANRSLPPAASPAAPISAAVFEVLEAEFLSLDGIIVDPNNPLGPVTGPAAAGGKAGGPSTSSPEAAAAAAAAAAADGLSESESLPSDAAPAFSSPALPANYPDERRQRRLLFDAVNEALGRRLAPFLLPSQPWQRLHAARSAPLRKRPAGRRLLQEVWAEIHSWAVPMSDDVFDTLDDLARRDLWKGLDTWNPLDKAVDDEVPDVVFQLEDVLMGELIGEICIALSLVEYCIKFVPHAFSPHFGNIEGDSALRLSKMSATASAIAASRPDGYLIAMIADEDTITGFLLAGVGHMDVRRRKNYLVVDSKTPVRQIEESFKEFSNREDVAVILISQYIANMIRYSIDSYNKPIPAVLEIPSKEHPYDPNQDSILSRVKHMFASSESVSDSRI
ncbi:unnamed protein product [Closterium sp. Yama58-4]|nr:unnamed protein product [Closterium sp. Yama58-4]